MMKTLSAAAAAVLIAGVAFADAANAQCYWTGYAWSCGYPGWNAPAAPGAWGYYDDRSGFGYQPRGLSHPYGPDPGGGYFHEGQLNVGHSD